MKDKIYNIITNFYKRFFSKKDEYRYLGLEDKYDKFCKKGKKLFFCVSVGRVGLRWLINIFTEHKNAIGTSEKFVMAESFYRYIKWNALPIDVQGVINLLKDSIVQDWKNNEISIYDTPYVSNDILNIYNILKPEYLIWGVNHPNFTITSFFNKGWYKEIYKRKDNNLIMGFQPEMSWSHIFGRPIPKDRDYKEWKDLTRIGKLAWLWNKGNLEIYNQLEQLPKEKIYIFKLEEADQNYEYYLNYAKKFGLKGILTKKKFLSIKWRTVKVSDNTQHKWSEKEKQEFDKYIQPFYNIYKSLN